MLTKEDADEKVKKGNIRALVNFHAVAINPEVVKKTLEELVNRLDKDKRAGLYKKEFSGTEEVSKPIKGVEKGYSQICETEFITKTFDDLVQIVIEYGPSSVEILEPKRIELPFGEAQSILNTISEIMHRFASAGAGGFVYLRGEI